MILAPQLTRIRRQLIRAGAPALSEGIFDELVDPRIVQEVEESDVNKLLYGCLLGAQVVFEELPKQAPERCFYLNPYTGAPRCKSKTSHRSKSVYFSDYPEASLTLTRITMEYLRHGLEVRDEGIRVDAWYKETCEVGALCLTAYYDEWNNLVRVGRSLLGGLDAEESPEQTARYVQECRTVIDGLFDDVTSGLAIY